MSIKNRKKGHIDISLTKNVEANINAGFQDVAFIHNALPEASLSEIDTSVQLFGHRLEAPLILESMTGGVAKATRLNRLLAKCAEEYGLAIGVGSQRAAIENPDLAATYSVVREYAPDAFIFANLGCPQFAAGYGIEEAKISIEMIQADALIVHSNPLQESIQPEGETDFRGVLSKIGEVASSINVPLVVKETGSGISSEVAFKIEKIGAKGIDVAGAGGTSWAAVEYFRAVEAHNRRRQSLGRTFRDWGITSCASIVEVSRSTKLTVLASGGVRSGLDVAKSIALGAVAAGAAMPFLKAANRGKKFLNEQVETYIEELKTTMFLVGVKNLVELRSVPIVITGHTSNWLNQRGFITSDYAQRKASCL